MSTFDYKAFEEFTKSWETASEELTEFLEKFLLQMAMKIIREAKEKTPKDIGAMQASWGIGSQNLVIKNVADGKVALDTEKSTVASIDILGDSFQVSIWNGMEYAL